MQLTNSSERFGLLTKILHWAIFILFVTQYYLVYRREYFEEKAPEKLQYILLHKSLGVIVLGVALLMLIWRHIGKRPPLPTSNAFKRLLAKVTHIGLYVSMLIMPISGIAMSMYSGYGVKVFGWPIPFEVEKNKELAGTIYTVHEYTSYVVIALVSLHVLGALFNHFVEKNNVLKRMTIG